VSNWEKGKEINDKNDITKCVVPVTSYLSNEHLNITTNNNLIDLSKNQLIERAFALHSKGKIKESLEYYQYFINKGYSDERVFSNYGNVLRNLGKLEKAEYLTRQAINLNPNFDIAHNNLGIILKDQGKIEEAELFTRKAIKLNPRYADAHCNLGRILLVLGKSKDAELMFKKAIDLNPKNAESYANLGGIFRDIGKLNKAKEYIEKAIKLKPDCSLAYFNLSITQYLCGNILSSIKSIEKAKYINKESKDIKLFYSIINSKLKEKANIDKSKNLIKDEAIYCFKREVEEELIEYLYKIKTLDLNKYMDPSFGNARGSDYELFTSDSYLSQKLEKDIIKIAETYSSSNIFIRDSFFTILGEGGIVKKHNHIGIIDKLPGLNIGKQKYSLVYYVSVGDQYCKNPGILKFHEPDKEILPCNGMLIIFPADRYHSVIYDGKEDRIIIGVNFYIL
tara:strand:+ start:519 stop:1871 length:1353 start_codon:yes stop_codon:yes gene_type:complete